MDYLFTISLKKTSCFLFDIFKIRQRMQEEHLKLDFNCLRKSDADNFQVNLLKSCRAKTGINGLGIYLNMKFFKL